MARAFTIVMAGGSGTRFWPMSRAERPKQLLPLAGGETTLLAATVERALRTSAPEDVLVVTNERLAEATRAALPRLPAENILAEPVGRNTAPCIGWACARVARTDDSAICAVLPADHHIGEADAYDALVRRALDAASLGQIVTIGVRPSRAETGYGYIEIGEPLAEGVHRARRFVEKPNRQRAEQFLAAGRYVWNSGMFFFRARTMIDAIHAHLPALGAMLDQLAGADAEKESSIVRAAYPGLPDVSIDHGVMEKVSDVAVVPGEFGWSDLGSFATAWELATRDGANNSVSSDCVIVDASSCFVRAPEGKIVALIGVSDLVVVDTEDALLVVPRERVEEVKRVVAALRARGDEEHL